MIVEYAFCLVSAKYQVLLQGAQVRYNQLVDIASRDLLPYPLQVPRSGSLQQSIMLGDAATM